ncbi:MAG TPA: barstar family protein [Jatrophihabitans sp.]|nr:barstar family protein [Jatrophihabitans sp.]
MTDRRPAWTSLAELAPWLRGQAVHLAAADAEPTLVEVLSAAGFTLARAAGAGNQPIADALRLPSTAGTNLDALNDSLRDLSDRWPGTDRLALLVPDAQILVRSDLLGWLQLSAVLEQATGMLWQTRRLVFETVFLVPADSFGADSPS